MEKRAREPARPFLAGAQITSLLLVASLPLMKLSVPVAGYDATLTDELFLICAALAAVAVLHGELRITWDGFFWMLLGYFAALGLSLFASQDLAVSAIKLATQLYLVALPALLFWLADSAEQLKRLIFAWLIATAIPALIGMATVIAYYAGVDQRLLQWALHGYGTLPPGHYPRLETTFAYAAMLCNYLTVGVFLLFYARLQAWLNWLIAMTLLLAICVTAAFTITPGLGGFVLALSICFYWSDRNSRCRKLTLIAGTAAAALSVVVAAFTPITHSTASFAITLPSGAVLYPAVRLMMWMAAAGIFLAHPLLGAGIGNAGLAVRYANPSGLIDTVTDAHDVYLSIACQAGIVGLVALMALIFAVMLTTAKYLRAYPPALPLLLGAAWLDCFAVQGFTGSYEDARHLWVLLGLWLASVRLEPANPESSSLPQGYEPFAASEAGAC